MNNSSKDPIVISSDANGVYIKEGSSATTTLTTDRVVVDYLRFTKFEVAGGHAAVQIDASFSYNTSNPQVSSTKTLRSAISRVSAAVFDSDLIPNADDTWNLGQITPNSRWQNGYFSGVLSVGSLTTENSAILSLDSTTKGFLPPRMTTGERDSIASPAAGLIIYNTSSSTFDGFDGTSWGELGGAGLWTEGSGSDIYRLNGNIGIGTSSPETVLHIATANNTKLLKLTSNASAELVLEPQNDANKRFMIQAYAGWLRIGDYTSGSYKENLSIVGSTGNVGIGTTSPAKKLHVLGGSGGSDGDNSAVVFENNSSSWSDVLKLYQSGEAGGAGSDFIEFYVDAGKIGDIDSNGAGTVSYNAFTGSHYAWSDNTFEYGQLVSMTGDNKRMFNNEMSEPVYGIKLSSEENSQAILGTYFGFQGAMNGIDNVHSVAAAGNGDMWVVDMGRDLKVGDYLISSRVPGYAMLEDGTYSPAYVIARVAEPVDWGEVKDTVEDSSATHKRKRISVIFGNFVIRR